MMAVHTTAIVAESARLEETVEVGAYSIIEDDVVIGRYTRIKPFAVVCQRAVIGDHCEIGYGAVVGAPPQHTLHHNVPSRVRIGDRTVIREYVTIHRSIFEDGETLVGDECYLMAFSHVGHDCVLGQRVVLTHMGTLGGHCRVGDGAIIGGAAVVHQRVDIGRLAMIGGASGVSLSVLPYAMVMGSPPAKIVGVNVRGMERAGIPKDRIGIVEDIFRAFRRIRDRAKLMEILENEIPRTPERDEIISFLAERTAVSHF